MKEHLQEYIAELLAHVGAVAAPQRIIQLVRFFNEIGAKGVVRLRTVPVTSRAKIAHERERVVERCFIGHRSSGARKLFPLRLARQ